MRKLENLCRYYLSCLGQEGEGISVFADSRHDLDYVELAAFPDANNENFVNRKDLQKLRGKIRENRTRMEMYLGYPSTLKKVKSRRSDWEGFFLEPLLVFPVDLHSENLKIDYTLPAFNLSALKRFTNSSNEELMNELVQLEQELGLSSDDDMPELGDAVKKLMNIRPEWSWKESINPDELCTIPPIRQITEEGIYNKAVFVIGERSPFTQGLETELNLLSKVQEEQYENTALGRWIAGTASKRIGDENRPLLEVLPLNSEQRQAIQHSLENSLTVVTGPPGTGKSQVVTNLLINAAWQGKKILFASKNNKAVDVVETRINNLGGRSILLRMGSRQYQANLAEYLLKLLDARTSQHDEEEYAYHSDKHSELETKFLQLNRQEKKLIDLRNETDKLDQAMERNREEISSEAFDKLRCIDIEKFRTDMQSWQQALDDSDKTKQSFLMQVLWVFVKKNRYKKIGDAAKKLQWIASMFEINAPTASMNDKNMHEWNAFSKNLERHTVLVETSHKYWQSRKFLKETKSLEEITAEKISLGKKMTSNAENLWNLWLRSVSQKLSSEDRKMLNNHITTLRMVIDEGGGGGFLGKRIFSEYSRLTDKVAHLLPVWAVTSLSAHRKIPFHAGYFDIVVFDEASQCDIASALPLLYRAKQVVVIGDVKQLRHITRLKRVQDIRLQEKYNLTEEHRAWSYSYTSLFELTLGLVSGNDIINLVDHHRSHAEIIEFSNKEFYDGDLRVVTNYAKLKAVDSEQAGIRWVNVVGEVTRPAAGGAVNVEEAKSVCEEITKLIEKNYDGSIGVVTPFRQQANEIRKIINNNTVLQTKLVNRDFLVDTVHKFQGDERDVMVFSPVVSKNMPRGALSFMKNNGNLFNVAITRARAMLLVVGDQGAAISCAVSYLENFARYSQQLETETKEDIENAIPNLGSTYPTVAHPERVSGWERILYEALYHVGISTIPQYQVEKYTLDLALFDGDRCLDIEVDGERYHRNWTGELCRRDQIRNQRLFELGWDVKRFWVYEVRDNIDSCVEQIRQWINS